ncbi:uncharacterized protein LOC144921182 [Branchiostoma floridae x Branchiostoma belcheri]
MFRQQTSQTQYGGKGQQVQQFKGSGGYEVPPTSKEIVPAQPGFPGESGFTTHEMRAELRILNKALEEFFEKCRLVCKGGSGAGGIKVDGIGKITFRTEESGEAINVEADLTRLVENFSKLQISAAVTSVDAIQDDLDKIVAKLIALKALLEEIKGGKDMLMLALEAIIEKYKKVTIVEIDIKGSGGGGIPSLDQILVLVRKENAHLAAQFETEWKAKMELIFQQMQMEIMATAQAFIGVDIKTYSSLMTAYAACCPEGSITPPSKGGQTITGVKGSSSSKTSQQTSVGYSSKYGKY